MNKNKMETFIANLDLTKQSDMSKLEEFVKNNFDVSMRYLANCLENPTIIE